MSQNNQVEAELYAIELAGMFGNKKVVGHGHPCRLDNELARVRINRIYRVFSKIFIELMDNEGEVMDGFAYLVHPSRLTAF